MGLIAVTACHKNSSTVEDKNVEVISMTGNVSEGIDGEIDYILLDTCASSGIAWVDKVMVSPDNSLWVMDQRRRTLAEYDRTGKWIKSLNKFGQGPEEYLNLNDFEVSGNGDIYIVDGRLDKIMVYDKDLLFKRSAKPEFESDAIHLLPNGNIAFGLSSWDKKYGEEWKVVVCDSILAPVDFLIPADGLYDPNLWLGYSGFGVMSDGTFLYNREIDDHVYLFNPEGKIDKVFKLDFGKYTVPDETRKNIENDVNFDNYRCVVNRVGYSDGRLSGNLRLDGKFGVFSANTETAKIGVSDMNLVNCGFVDDAMAECLTSVDEMEGLPDSVMSHLKNEGIVIRLTRFK